MNAEPLLTGIDALMRISWASLTTAVVIVGGTVQAQQPNVERHVHVIAPNADIHLAPSSTSEVVAQAQQGDIFVSLRTEGEWYSVTMPSMFGGYLHETSVELMTMTREMRASLVVTVTRTVCVELVNAQERAAAEVRREFGNDLDERVEAERARVLADRYSLQIFRENGIAPSEAFWVRWDCEGTLIWTPSRIGDNIFAILSPLFGPLAVGFPFLIVGGGIVAAIVARKRAKRKAGKPLVKEHVLWTLNGLLWLWFVFAAVWGGSVSIFLWPNTVLCGLGDDYASCHAATLFYLFFYWIIPVIGVYIAGLVVVRIRQRLRHDSDLA